jgi:type II secretory pathway pseudopilin PulG
MRVNRRSPLSDDSGFSIIELLVYIMLGVLVLTVVGVTLVNSIRGSILVRASAETAGGAQLVAQSLNRGIHNASAINVNKDSTVLLTRSIDSSPAGVWQCQAWIFTGTTIRTSTSPTAISLKDVSKWTVLASNVKTIDTVTPASGKTKESTEFGKVFELVADPLSTGSSVQQVRVRFIADGLPIAKPLGRQVQVDTAIMPKQPILKETGESSPCF